MKEICLSKTIADLRRTKGITQEQLAEVLHVTPQAVSKWETAACQPDTLILPQIADYFNVSVDYLFYGKTFSYDDIYRSVRIRLTSFPQMCSEAYEEVYRIFATAHLGLFHGNGWSRESQVPIHISNEGGISLIGGQGYGAIVTREFFRRITGKTFSFAVPLLTVLADEMRLRTAAAIVSMSDSSQTELRERLNCTEAELEEALGTLVESGLVKETVSKHKMLGKTYAIHEEYHSCLCILLATLEIQRLSLAGLSCCMGYGDYPIGLN